MFRWSPGGSETAVAPQPSVVAVSPDGLPLALSDCGMVGFFADLFGFFADLPAFFSDSLSIFIISNIIYKG